MACLAAAAGTSSDVSGGTCDEDHAGNSWLEEAMPMVRWNWDRSGTNFSKAAATVFRETDAVTEGGSSEKTR
jgi:hypothetical protein